MSPTAQAGTEDPNAIWAKLLTVYVTEHDTIRYDAWKQNIEDQKLLAEYLNRIASFKDRDRENAKARLALLINAYNAILIEQVLQRYPIASIHAVPRLFTERKHIISGKTVSINELEEEIRAFADFRVHSAIVAAARSAPPLRREPYTGPELDDQLDDQMRTWLRRTDLNWIDTARRELHLSKLFTWYKRDFGTSDNAILSVISRYGPEKWSVAAREDYRIAYASFDWELNDSAS